MVLTTGAASPLVTLFPHAFSGLSLFVSEVPEQPKVSSPPLEEDITNAPSTPMVMMLSPRPSWAPFQLSHLIVSKHVVVNCAINSISIWSLNNDKCKDLAGFAFNFGYSLPSVNGSCLIFTHSGIPYLLLSDPCMTSSQCDPLGHSVYLMSDHHPLSTI
ncbi:hypothetical protein DSO57_1018125 [Entomophthora muscae]|uniref:Uncharacterized protein n=1 Tax=Entomophthora muscae TaxID=34485 RepID=A0ACC2T4G9_9FUNG|nr:hypothetical protein DSO57_1018125 [Entomophthora muscae]